MLYLFRHLDAIERQLQQAPFGLITDVDGTISHIAPTPEEAEVTPLCRRYLARLSQHLPLVAAISGRPTAAVREMVGIDEMVYIGNHGLERWQNGRTEMAGAVKPYLGLISRVVQAFSRQPAIEGIIIEDKGAIAAIHYRLSPNPELAEKAILDTVNVIPEIEELHLRRGKRVIEILPPLEVDKGTAIRDLITEYHLNSALYLGDDRTDSDAFRAIHAQSNSPHFQGYAIAVTNPEMPENLIREADFTVNGVTDVERFLRWLYQNVAGRGGPHHRSGPRASG